MPRIRTVKPEVWTDRKFVSLTPYARLFFIGMWNFALCDDGHIEDDDFQLKLKILPADNVDAAELIDELVSSGLVARLPDVDGGKYLHVRGLRKHQKTDTRWTPRCPVCSHLDSPGLTETHASLDETHRASPELRGNSPQEGKGRERKGKESTCSSSDEDFNRFWSIYPRKVAKKAARSRWDAALKTSTPEQIINGAEQYAKKCEVERTDKKFIKQPDGWLLAGRWEDEIDIPDPARTFDPWNPNSYREEDAA